MDDADDLDADEGEDEGEDVPTWADLFARAGAYDTDESAVREALARRRERADD